ncbi:MAG: 3'-5' exonuclease [Bacteroidetes bacterium]|nr:3'-5' exonuclease [Bacteroidota bacterium]
MKLNLTRPLAFIDLETTGVNVASDRIVEICILKVNTDNSTEVKTMRINPGIPIPDASSRIHKIYDSDVKDCPAFKQVAAQLANFIGNADIAGYNSNKFDVPLLLEEFLRAEVDFDLSNRRLIDVQNIFHIMEPRTLAAAYKFYCDKSIENAHSAEADIKATYEVFLAQLKKYENTEVSDAKGNLVKPVKNDMQVLSELTAKTKNVDLAGRIIFNDAGVEVFAFGKHKDKPVVEVFEKEPSYYSWMMNGDFPLYTKKIITQIRLRMKK